MLSQVMKEEREEEAEIFSLAVFCFVLFPFAFSSHLYFSFQLTKKTPSFKSKP